MATLEGEYPRVERVELGLWSLDRALSSPTEVGWPMTIYEVFGNQGVGKTTFSTSIAGMVAEYYGKKIVYAPIEHMDREYMGSILDSVGFMGVATILGGDDMVKKFFPHSKMKKGEIVTDEIIIDSLIEAVRRDEYCFGILDSLTAISPIEETESSSADKNMGRRGRLAAVLSRGILQANRFRSTPYSTVILAHKVVEMGGGMKTTTGTSTTGGEGKKNIAKVRISIKNVQEKTMNDLDDNCFILEGRAEKMNFGKPGKHFYAAILGGKGIHKGMTALVECEKLEIATFGKSISLGEKSFGSMRTVVAKAHEGDDEFFQPFIDALKHPSDFVKIKKAKKNEEEVWEEGEE
jgi:RecA/RadA recombinase